MNLTRVTVESFSESSTGPSVRLLRCFRGPLRSRSVLGFEPVLLVVAPSGHEHQSHLHLSGDNLTPSRDPGYKRTSGSGGSCCMWSCCDDHKISAG